MVCGLWSKSWFGFRDQFVTSDTYIHTDKGDSTELVAFAGSKYLSNLNVGVILEQIRGAFIFVLKIILAKYNIYF